MSRTLSETWDFIVTSQVHLYHSIVKIYDSEGHSKLTILQAKQIVKTYGTKQTIQEVLRGIDLNIETESLFQLWDLLDLVKQHYLMF